MKPEEGKIMVKFRTPLRCNCNCVYCGLYNGISEEESRRSFDDVIGMLKFLDKRHVSGIKIIGGEPLLEFERLLSLIKACDRKGISFILTTNAVGMDSSKVEKLVNAGLKDIAISLDSPDRATHNRIRRNGKAFDSAVSAIHHISSRYPSVHVQVNTCLLYTSPSPRDLSTSRMPSSA